MKLQNTEVKMQNKRTFHKRRKMKKEEKKKKDFI